MKRMAKRETKDLVTFYSEILTNPSRFARRKSSFFLERRNFFFPALVNIGWIYLLAKISMRRGGLGVKRPQSNKIWSGTPVVSGDKTILCTYIQGIHNVGCERSLLYRRIERIINRDDIILGERIITMIYSKIHGKRNPGGRGDGRGIRVFFRVGACFVH